MSGFWRWYYHGGKEALREVRYRAQIMFAVTVIAAMAYGFVARAVEFYR